MDSAASASQTLEKPTWLRSNGNSGLKEGTMVRKKNMSSTLPAKSLWAQERCQANKHDEWLLDEALTETFPASDSIAVTPSHLLEISSERDISLRLSKSKSEPD
jgi:hypothetical protein